MINLQYTCSRSEKYLSKLNISRSFIRIFAVNRINTTNIQIRIMNFKPNRILFHLLTGIIAVGGNLSAMAEGNIIYFDTPTSSIIGSKPWLTDEFSYTVTNPDQQWEQESLPIGNGAFGGAILGSVARERVVINEKSLWFGGPGTGAEQYWDMNQKVSKAQLDSIRTLLKEGKTDEAHQLTARIYAGTTPYDRTRFGCFTEMGEAYVNTGIDESKISNYSRKLDIDNAIASVSFNLGNAKYERQYIASYPDSIMAWRYTSEGATQNLVFEFASPHKISRITSPAPGSLIYSGALEGNGMKWALRVDIKASEPGKVIADAVTGQIRIKDASDVVFLLSGDTDYVMNFDPDFTDPKTYVGVDPIAAVNNNISKVTQLSFDQLKANHLADYHNLYNRVSININPTDDSKSNLISTPKRLELYRAGNADNQLEELYFQFGRYLLIASSRQGSMPANLQGLWHNNIDGPWRVDYHNNINLQMNYWPANSTNLAECFTPFIDYTRSLLKSGAKTAQDYYQARGWTAEVSTNIFGFTAPLQSTDMSWNYNPTAGPWLTTQIWEYYDYSRDKEWLRKVGYPIIKGSADFVSDLLILHNGTYTSAPSYSPEHGPCDLGATYANAVTREVLIEAIEAAKILNIDKKDIALWQEKLNNMYPYKIGQYGQLQEWYNDIDIYNDQHRHTNHLFGLHPGTTINPITDKAIADACRETLRQRGDAATGWSMGWKLNHWARLLDGDHAYILLQNLLKNGTADNLWDQHPPFQIDGNFGGTAGITELFLQSHNGEIHLLPALPSAWVNGSITGLRTRGNFEVDITYSDGKLQQAVIKSLSGNPCIVRYGDNTITIKTKKGAQYVITTTQSGKLKSTRK